MAGGIHAFDARLDSMCDCRRIEPAAGAPGAEDGLMAAEGHFSSMIQILLFPTAPAPY